jgi:O-antigen ligase
MNSGLIQQYFSLPILRLELLARAFLIASFFSLPISTAATNIFMGLTLIMWALAGGYKTRLNQLYGHWLAYGVVILFSVICIGGFYSNGSTKEIFFQIHKYAKILFILPAITLLQDDKWQRRALIAFSGAMFLTLALSLITVVWPLSFIPSTADGPTTNHFVFKDHIAQNLMMSFFALLLAVNALFAKNLSKKIILFSLAALAVVDILFFVAGRTGFISLALNALVLIFFLSGIKQKISGLLVFFIIAILALQYSDNFRGRVELAIAEFRSQEKKELTSVGQRVEFFKKSIELIKERPVFGFGTGSYAREFCRIADSTEWCEAGKSHPHNQFIAFLVQLGVIGFIAYLIFIAAATKSALYQSRPIQICGLGLVVTLIADSMTHAPLFLVTEAQFFILLFAALLVKNIKTHKTHSYAPV